ncbi:hypothetical protein [Kordiimonas aquimaris]|uniref:hypothetical protein n=1 Tax=Kordiimonas aquimaris TaxID=707591 RepID=UPI0021D0082E|nr:hypothetical protein [Kordiimonas aquimaris]
MQSENTDDQVIARLPDSNDPETVLLTRMRRYTQEHPDDLGTAVNLAHRYIAKGKNESDTRYLGYAAAVLKRWLDMEQTPTQITLLDAEIKQYNHDFSGALNSLGDIPQSTQQYPTAALMSANIHQIQGRFVEAHTNCNTLGTRMSHISEICTLSLASLTGDLDVARQKLQELLTTNSYQPEITTWALGKLMDMSVRSNRVQEALYYAGFMDKTLARAAFHRAQLADVLFMLNRPSDVLSLISEDEQSDALIVRRLRAQKILGQNWRSTASKRLERLFLALSKRGKNPHAREAAYYYLYLSEEPQKALSAALENWNDQKEPIDIRLLMETAKQSGNMNTVDYVVDWIIKNRYQDATIAKFLMPVSDTGATE